MLKVQWDDVAMDFLREDIPGSEELIPVFSISNGEYGWRQMTAFFSPKTKQFHWISSSGRECCNNLLTHVEAVSDLTSGTERDLKQALRTFLAENPSILKDSEKDKILSKIKETAVKGLPGRDDK